METLLSVVFLMVLIAVFITAIQAFKILRDSQAKEGKEGEKYEKNHRMLWTMVFAGYIVAIMGTFLIFTFIAPTPEEIAKGAKDIWNPTPTVFFLMLFHFIASFRVVQVTELGAVLFFGRELYQVSSGLRFVPWIVCKLEKEQRTTFEDELPADPEKIYRSKRNEPDFVPLELLEKGYRPPLRVTFAGVQLEEVDAERGTEKDGEEKKKVRVDDPLEERLTAEVPGIVRWRIVDFIKFLTVIGDREEAKKQMADVYISFITTELPKVTLKAFLADRDTYDKKIQEVLTATTKDWGIGVETVKIKEVGMSHELNVQIQEMAKSRAQKRANTLDGQGLGAKEYAVLKGRTDGLKYMVKELKLDANAILAAETTRDLAGKIDTFVAVGKGGIADVMGVVAAGAEVFKASAKPDADIPPKEGGAS